MVMRSSGSTVITFGLVSVPVKIYAATADSPEAIKFNLLHGACGSRLRQQYVCERCEAPVDRDQMVKGYEHEKGKYVTFTADEIKSLEEVSEYSEIVEFVFADSVPIAYLDKLYYLAPGKGGVASYALLLEALARTGRDAVARYTARGKQHVVVIRPRDGVLVMQTLRYADEVRGEDQVPVGDLPVVDSRHLDMACAIVEQRATAAFDPSRYRDEVGERARRAVESKVQTGTLAVEAPKTPGTVIDLMDALRASLKKAS